MLRRLSLRRRRMRPRVPNTQRLPTVVCRNKAWVRRQRCGLYTVWQGAKSKCRLFETLQWACVVGSALGVQRAQPLHSRVLNLNRRRVSQRWRGCRERAWDVQHV